MERIKCFELKKSSYYDGYYTINPVLENLPTKKTEGSYALLPARLMELSYANYCRFCRDQLDAAIIGKELLYPIVCFKKNPVTLEFVRLLNARANLLLLERKQNNNGKK